MVPVKSVNDITIIKITSRIMTITMIANEVLTS